jgi:hypothetical protein
MRITLELPVSFFWVGGVALGPLGRYAGCEVRF